MNLTLMNRGMLCNLSILLGNTCEVSLLCCARPMRGGETLAKCRKPLTASIDLKDNWLKFFPRIVFENIFFDLPSYPIHAEKP